MQKFYLTRLFLTLTQVILFQTAKYLLVDLEHDEFKAERKVNFNGGKFTLPSCHQNPEN